MAFDPTVGVIAVVPDRWDAVVMPRHHVLSRLAARFPVVWLEPALNWRNQWLHRRSLFRRTTWREPVPHLSVLTPGALSPEFHRPAWLADLSIRTRLGAARQRLIDAGAKRVILYLWRPYFYKALQLVEHDASCYHIDDEYSFDANDPPTSLTETRVLQRVDQVIVHSEELFKKKGGINPYTAQVPNGVDYAAFASPRPEPPDIARIPHPRIGYSGVIKKQLDLALLLRLAIARPQWSFVLVGPVLEISGKEGLIRQLQSMRNVHFLGNKPVEDLPSYVQQFDACLMCYEINNYTRYIYPLKLHEYLAAGRPIVSSAIAAVLQFESVVQVAKTDPEWLAAIQAGLEPAATTPEAVAARQAVARRYDWQVLVDEVSEILRTALARRIANHR